VFLQSSGGVSAKAGGVHIVVTISDIRCFFFRFLLHILIDRLIVPSLI